MSIRGGIKTLLTSSEKRKDLLKVLSTYIHVVIRGVVLVVFVQNRRQTLDEGS